MYLFQGLRYFFRDVPRVYVGADMLLYYEKGNTRKFKVPDVFVAKGVGKQQRPIYKLWEEGVAPCVIFEITSRKTKKEDEENKPILYQQWGVAEYFLFDPLDEYLIPRLKGFRLSRGVYQPITLSPEGTLYSHELDLLLRPEGALLRLVYPATGETVPTMDEVMEMADAAAEKAQAAAEQAQAATERARHESEARRAAEAEAERLRAELARLRGDTASADS
jgi:hypothetical protein